MKASAMMMARLRPTRRRAYILMAVLGFTAVVTALGWAFLSSHSTVMPEAVNRYGAVRAQYLAESGVALGSHFLMYPPSTVAGCSYWTGATGIAVDSTNDYTDVTVAQDASNADFFTITAVGVAKNPDGSVRGKHTVTAKVIRPTQNKVQLPYALIGDAYYMSGVFQIPPTAKVYGNVHANNGMLYGYGWCQGNVSATDWLCWMSCGGSGPPASVTGWVSAVSVPPMSPSNYSAYTVQGLSYTAYAYSSANISSSDAVALNAALDATMSTNPGRIVVRTGSLRLDDNAVVNATLAVTSALQINGTGITVTAVQNYPSIVVASNIVFLKDSAAVSFVGPVYIGGQIQDNSKNNVILNVTGTCLLKRGFNLNRSNGTYRFTYDCARSIFWDFANVSTDPKPITFLSWQET